MNAECMKSGNSQSEIRKYLLPKCVTEKIKIKLFIAKCKGGPGGAEIISINCPIDWGLCLTNNNTQIVAYTHSRQATLTQFATLISCKCCLRATHSSSNNNNVQRRGACKWIVSLSRCQWLPFALINSIKVSMASSNSTCEYIFLFSCTI